MLAADKIRIMCEQQFLNVVLVIIMLSSNYSVAVLIFSFWTSVMEDHQIEKLDQSYQIITALQEFLTTLNSPSL